MTREPRVTWHLAFIGAAALAFVVSEAKAEGDPDAAKAIVHEHCVDCHDVLGYESERKTPAIEAPSFAEMALDPGTYPPEDLRRSLQKPHWPMGQFRLSPRDIDSLLAFIESLDAN